MGKKRRSMNQPMPPITEEDAAEPFRRDIDRALGTDANRQPRNAFAEENLRVHRHRLAGNAFYQEAYSQRKHTPPAMVHPALRYDTNLYDISQALPELDADMVTTQRPSLEMQEVSTRRAHDSSETTMSPFINAGNEEQIPSSPLNLVPSPKATHPTLRNQYDERNTDRGQQEESDGENIIAVTRYSSRASHQDSGCHSQESKTSIGKDPASPKKSLLDRFRVPNRRGAVPLQPLPSMEESDGAPIMPAKARAVLVAKPPSHTVVRSPSKIKAFWARRKPSSDEDTGHQTPIPALKVLPHLANAGHSRNELPGYSRSLSLGYVDHSIPPTPPSKDTPPGERGRQEATGISVAPLTDSTPTRKKGFLSLSNRLSPNKTGGYGKRSNPTIVTQPSTHSLRASVVPSFMDGQDFNETRSRINGLGLEAFSLPVLNAQNGVTYSPSMYSPDMARGSMATFSPVIEDRHQKSESSSDAGISDMGDICIIYPELARDPSITSFMTPNKAVLDSEAVSAMDRSYSDFPRQEREPTVRRAGINIVIDEVDDMLRGEPSESDSASDSGLFAIPLGHASAQVSPLHYQPATFSRTEVQQSSSDLQPVMVNSEGYQILPATTYNPWDVQRQSNHSPSCEPRLQQGDASQTSTTNKKKTAAMPGLQYDSGVDVDPTKILLKQSTTSKYTQSSSPPRPSISRNENHKLGVHQALPDTTNAAELHTPDIMRRGDNTVKDTIASRQQEEIGTRLSNIEESMRQEALTRSNTAPEERRRLEQEALFDQRIASLEIRQFNREPSPTTLYGSTVPLRHHVLHRRSLSPSHAVSDRKKGRHNRSASATQSLGSQPDAKRISTGQARDFYQNLLRDSPVRNPGNIDTFTGTRSSSNSSDTLRPGAANDALHAPNSPREIATISQLQETIRQQQVWIQAAMARMDDIESKAERRDRGGN